MKILITGAGGWLGSELTEKLLLQGNNITALNLGQSKKLLDLKEKFEEKLEILDANITNYEILENVIKGKDQVYHLAARVHFIPTNEDENREFYKTNTEASIKLFDLCLRYNVDRVIFYSTVAVYEESDKEITVESKRGPITHYGISKLKAEEYALKLHKENGFPITIIEPVTVYGGDDVGNFKKLEGVVNKGISIIFGDGNNKKTIIYYKDLIDITISVSNDEACNGKIIICGTENISLNEIHNVLIKNSNKKVVKIRINKSMINVILKIIRLIPLKAFKRIHRQITVLMSNNIYNTSNSKQYMDKYTTFGGYYEGE